LSIDYSKALALPGVEVVCTHEDIPSYIVYGIPFGLSDDIRFCGQFVAIVAAVDEDTAERATQLIDVEYEILPHVVEAEEAIQPGAPLAGAFADSNVSAPSTTTRGDIEAGFAEADVIGEYELGWLNVMQVQQIEPHSAVAYWVGDHVYVWCSAQGVFLIRSGVAGPLGLDHNKVHAINHGSGGGFGDKILHAEIGCIAAAVARKAEKPVQFHLSRAENYNTRGHHNASKMTVRLGAKNDGTLTAYETTTYGDGYNAGFAFTAGEPRPMYQTFKCPNGKFTHHNVATNKPPTGAWRGPPDHSGAWHTDMALTMFAEELGMNPLDFMLKNLFDGGAEPDQDTGKPWDSFATDEQFEKLRDAIGWDAKYHAPGARTLPDGRMHGIAIHCHSSNFGSMSSRIGAIINLTPDGKCLLSVGTSRCGSGAPTAFCCIVAETLGMNFDDVNVGEWGNTDTSADGGSQGGSTRVTTLGSAFHMAALDARGQLFETAAGMLDVTPEELGAREGKIFVKADPTQFKTHAEVASRAVVIGYGYSWPKQLQRPLLGFPAGTSCEARTSPGLAVEVAVDTETGEVEILNAVGAMEMGKAIFWQGCHKHILGGIEVEAGEALYWGAIHDKVTGIRLNPNFIDYKHPTSLDCNAGRNQVIITEANGAMGPYGAKGLGEPVVLSCAAFAPAIYNAIGVWVTEGPISPLKILKALGKA
jgi:CO/xanthine dehydrogenase Mo-binding subunit